MPAKNPRINVVMDKIIFDNVRTLADKDGVSLSTKARDLIKQALEIQEDIYLADIAAYRETTLKDQKPLSHDDIWS